MDIDGCRSVRHADGWPISSDFRLLVEVRTLPHKPYIIESRQSTDLRPHERRAFWADAITSLQGPMELAFPRTRNFHGGYTRIGTDDYQLVDWKADEARYERRVRHNRVAPDEDYRFVLPIAKRLVVRQHGDVTYLRQGLGGLFTYDKPFDCWNDAEAQMMVLTITRREIENRIKPATRLSVPLDLSKGLGGVAQELALGLLREGSALTGDQFEAISERLVDLICMLVIGDDRPDESAVLGEIETMARRYIRRHVEDPNLSGLTVAHALGWSLRQVQLALQEAGTTPRKLIREERLKVARARLCNPAYRHLDISEVAAQLGFSAASNFSTAFRRRFGIRPRDVRHETFSEAATDSPAAY